MDPKVVSVLHQFKFCPTCGGKLKIGIAAGEDLARPRCQSCGFIFYQNPKPVICAMIERPGPEVLVLQRNMNPYKDGWGFCGGFVELGETYAETVRREVQEEAGMTVTGMEYYFNEVDYYINEKDNQITCNLSSHFIVSVRESEPKLGPEVKAAYWTTWDKLPEPVVGFLDVIAVIRKRKSELGIEIE